MKLVIFLCLSGMLFHATAAQAQWVHRDHENAFDGKRLQVALIVQGNLAAGLQCTNADDLEVVFLTPEDVTGDAAEGINFGGPEILLRVDQNDVHSLQAHASEAQGKLLLQADAPFRVLEELIEARSAVSVALRFLGAVFHETEFGVMGSTRTLSSLADTCGIDLLHSVVPYMR